MLCDPYRAMAFLRKLVVCVFIQFLIIWTYKYWNTGNGHSDEHTKEPRETKINNIAQNNHVNVEFRLKKEHSKPKRDSILSVAANWKSEYYNEIKCARKGEVVFVKAYYSGGSTIQNILSRLGLKMNKKVLSHVDCVPRLSTDIGRCKLIDIPFFSDMKYTENVEMALGHIKFRRKEIHQVFPPDTPLITILRHPLEQAQYDFHYRGLTTTEKIESMAKKGAYQNSKLFDVPKAAQKNHTKLRKYLDTIDETFAHVGIAEYFDESLILLKRKLCLSLEDILYIDSFKLPSKGKILPETLTGQVHRQNNLLDYKIYEYFHDKLLTTLSWQDKSFSDEYSHFQKVNKVVNNFCLKFYSFIRRTLDLEADNRVLEIPSTAWNAAFNVTRFTCAAMKVNNNIYEDIFLIKRYPELCNVSELYTHKENLSGLCLVHANTTVIPKQILFDPDSYNIDSRLENSI